MCAVLITFSKRLFLPSDHVGTTKEASTGVAPIAVDEDGELGQETISLYWWY